MKYEEDRLFYRKRLALANVDCRLVDCISSEVIVIYD